MIKRLNPLLLVIIFLGCLGPVANANSKDLPDNSIYHLDGQWRDQEGKPLVLADLAGRPRLLSFVYTYCEHTCPTIVARLKMVTADLPESLSPPLQVTLVTLDPERDTPERIKAWLSEQNLDDLDWRMLHGDPDEVLGFAAMLGVRYRPMGEQDIAHSNMITLLDSQGVVQYQSKGLGDDPAEISEAIVALGDTAGD